jgi:hypothetical protein
MSRRHGAAIGPWLDELPAVLGELAKTWKLDIHSVVRRGTVSLVLNCRGPLGTPPILKVSPDQQRIADEARALSAWHTPHVPHVVASHAGRGALLMEAIQPGTAVDESGRLPAIPALAELVHAIHEQGPPPSTVPRLEDRIAMWKADDPATVAARARALGRRLGVSEETVLRWCAAFAAMIALKLAEAAPPGAGASSRITMLLELEGSF